MKKISLLITGIIIYIGLPFLVNAQGLMSHNFDDGEMGPFVKCTTKDPNYARVENKRLVTYWTESSYDSTRMTKGAEACGDPSANGIGYLTIKHCWLGFTMHIDANYMKDNYKDTEGGLMQIFGFDESLGQSSWTAMLDYKFGDLTWVDRRNYNPKTYAIIYENYPRGVDVDIIVHVVLSAVGNGTVEVFLDGVKKYSRYNTDVGMGEFNSNDEQDWDSYTEFKIGQYNYDNTGYLDGEERIVYYDNISWYDGEEGYSLVDPSGTTGTISSVHTTTPSINARFRLTGINELEITPVNPLHGDIDISLFSPSGKMLNTYSTNSAAPICFKVRNSGLYLVKLQCTTDRLIKKIVVQ